MVRELVCENQRRATPFSDFSQEALQTATGMGDKGGVPFSDERMERKYAACLPPPPAPARPSPRTSPLWPRRYTGLSGVWLRASLCLSRGSFSRDSWSSREVRSPRAQVTHVPLDHLTLVLSRCRSKISGV